MHFSGESGIVSVGDEPLLAGMILHGPQAIILVLEPYLDFFHILEDFCGHEDFDALEVVSQHDYGFFSDFVLLPPHQ